MKDKVFSILVVFFVLFSLAPTFYEIAKIGNVRPERYFELVHNFPTDFNFYRSRIREGMDGKWLVTERYTSEPHEGSFIHIFYLLLGALGRWNRVPYWLSSDVYHVARTVLGATLLAMFVAVAKHSFERKVWRIAAFILAVTASSWPVYSEQFDGWRSGGYMPWWSVMDSLQRITFLPHLVAGQTLIAFILLAFATDSVLKRRGNMIFLGILVLLLGVIFPPGYVFLVPATGVMIAMEYVYMGFPHTKTAFQQFVFERVFPRLVPLLIGAPALFYLQYMTSFYPWKRLAEFDIVKPLPYDAKEYFLAVGPVLPLGVIGLIIALRQKSKPLILATSWVLSWGMLLYIFQFIPQQSPLRFSQMIPHVPLAVLSVSGMTAVAAWFGKNAMRLAKKDMLLSHVFSIVQSLFLAVPILLIGVFLFHMYGSYLWQRDFVDHKMRAQYPLVPTGSYVMYPLVEFMNAMWWIKDNTPPDEVILSETTAGNYIPVYAGQRVYVGHANTVKAEEKELLVSAFFSGTMKLDEAKAFLEERSLHYIFFGPQEREGAGGKELRVLYPFLTPIHTTGVVTIYRY